MKRETGRDEGLGVVWGRRRGGTRQFIGRVLLVLLAVMGCYGSIVVLVFVDRLSLERRDSKFAG